MIGCAGSRKPCSLFCWCCSILGWLYLECELAAASTRHQMFYGPPTSWWKQKFHMHSHPHWQMLFSCTSLFKYWDAAVWLFLLVTIALSTRRVTWSNRQDLPRTWYFKTTKCLYPQGLQPKRVTHTRGIMKPSFWFTENEAGEQANLDAVPGVFGDKRNWQLEEISVSQSLCRQEYLKLSCTQWELGALGRGRWSCVRKVGPTSFSPTWSHVLLCHTTQETRNLLVLSCNWQQQRALCQQRKCNLPLDVLPTLTLGSKKSKIRQACPLSFVKSTSGQVAGRVSTSLQGKSVFLFLLCVFCWWRKMHTVAKNKGEFYFPPFLIFLSRTNLFCIEWGCS